MFIFKILKAAGVLLLGTTAAFLSWYVYPPATVILVAGSFIASSTYLT